MTGYSEADARAVAIVIYQARALWGRDICTHVRADGFAIYACGTGALATCLGCNRRYCAAHLSGGRCEACPLSETQP